MKLAMKRVEWRLEPVDEDGADTLYALPPGKEVIVEVRQARNPRFHRFAFALFQAVVHNTDDFTTIEALKTWLKVRLGYADPIIDPAGRTMWVVRSLSFESMDEPAFREFFERAVDLVVQTWGWERPALMKEIEGRCGLHWTDDRDTA